MSYIISSDIGGTFTDTVVLDASGSVKQFKAPTTHGDLKDGVLATLEMAAADVGIALGDFLRQVSRFAHGTTVATNAMLERRGSRVGLIQTKGFGDTLSIMLAGGRGDGRSEDEMRRLSQLTKPSPLVDPGLVVEVAERIDKDGKVVAPLTEAAAREAVQTLIDRGAESIAVSLLWSFQNPVHERLIEEIVSELSPQMFTTISSELIPRIREYSRTSTTAINSYIGPILGNSLSGLADELKAKGLQSEPFLMQSNGGLSTVSRAIAAAASTLLSGPAGGVAGAAKVGQRTGLANLVTADMGGTSFDVGLVTDGLPTMSTSYYMGQYPVALPAVGVHTIGAGGGSIAAVRDGFLNVGPQSAGSTPGPACFGKGGTDPTVTDANLVLGFIEANARLGGKLALDRDLAVKAIEEKVAKPLGLGVMEAAAAIRTIADNKMADLIRQVTISQGHDPRDFTLVAFGGGGPTHAAYLAADAGISTVIVPSTAAVHSAYGIATSQLRATTERSVLLSTPASTERASMAMSPSDVNPILENLARSAIETLVSQGAKADDVTLRFVADVRMRSQIHELSIELPRQALTEQDLDELPQNFVTEYEARFGKGSALAGAGIELVTLRVDASAPPSGNLSDAQHVDASAADSVGAVATTRDIYLPELAAAVPVDIFEGSRMAAGTRVNGPAVVELPNTSVFVGSGQSAEMNHDRSIIISTKGNLR
ncbi:hydantoinase/oxoprolinase family protein [Nocardia sp. NPDC059228]|uniref:hydantoinase/oxoprolinase family protein n=1 Tax=Nocardia sp. NPDC059228 TaxID=3346777 RepID=UPI003679F8F8